MTDRTPPVITFRQVQVDHFDYYGCQRHQVAIHVSGWLGRLLHWLMGWREVRRPLLCH